MNTKGAVQTKQGQLPTIQARQTPYPSKFQPVQRSTVNTDLKEAMGGQHGVDLSGYQEHKDSTFPEKVGTLATIQGKDIHYAPGQFTEQNRKHELGHAIDNTLNGIPTGDKVVNGQTVDTTREAAADKIAATPLQKKEAPHHQAQKTETTPANAPVQRYIGARDNQGVIRATQNGHRPPGSLAGSQGDHTTPFITLQHQLMNAINGNSPADAWDNLVATHAMYQTLPGYNRAPAWLRNQSNQIRNQNQGIDSNTVSQEEVVEYANNLLTIRNRLPYTSLPTRGGSTGGNDEANTAGALQYLEEQLQGGNATDETQQSVLISMAATFDAQRFEDVTNDTQRDEIIAQHIATLLDAYPTVVTHFAITADLLRADLP